MPIEIPIPTSLDKVGGFVDELMKENAQLRRMVEDWTTAALKHYPPNWTFDPTNPELVIANIVEYRAAFGIGNRGTSAEQSADATPTPAMLDAKRAVDNYE